MRRSIQCGQYPVTDAVQFEDIGLEVYLVQRLIDISDEAVKVFAWRKI